MKRPSLRDLAIATPLVLVIPFALGVVVMYVAAVVVVKAEIGGLRLVFGAPLLVIGGAAWALSSIEGSLVGRLVAVVAGAGLAIALLVEVDPSFVPYLDSAHQLSELPAIARSQRSARSSRVRDGRQRALPDLERSLVRNNLAMVPAN